MEPTDIRTRLRDAADEAPPAGPIPGAAARAPIVPAGSAPGPATTQVLPPSAFRSGQPEEALQDALGYGFYARAAEEGREPARAPGDAPTADMVARYRAQAAADLHAFAFRYLHNHAEQIRQDAVREHLGRLRRPPGFLKLATASTLGVLVAATLLAALWPWVEAHGGIAAAAQALAAHLRSLAG